MTVWAIWFGVCFASFIVIETWALLTGRPTLSTVIWTLGHECPLFAVSFGAIVGGLMVHFFES